MATEPLRGDTAYSKACAYLNFNRRALWLAHAAAVGTTLLTLALLVVLWLFADLVVWRGRVPAARELSPKQVREMDKFWRALSPEERGQWLADANFTPTEAEKLAEKPFSDQPDEAMELIWEEFVWYTLRNRVGESAISHVFVTSNTRSGYHIDAGNRGILSLIVREYASGRTWTPLSFIASWNGWMWNGRPGDAQFLPRNSYLLGLALLVVILGLSWALLVVLNREMAARATVEATSRLRRAVYHHTFRLGTLAIRALGPSEAGAHIMAGPAAEFTHRFA